jgi:hypothetical protein
MPRKTSRPKTSRKTSIKSKKSTTKSKKSKKGGRSKGKLGQLQFLYGKKRVTVSDKRDIAALRVTRMKNGAWRLYGTCGDKNVSKFVSADEASKWKRG